jgi:uncharacterized protein (TIGR02594 family)
MKINVIQKALKKQGYNPGATDGAWGRPSINALKDFQEANGLDADGVLTVETVGILLAKGKKSSAGSLETAPVALPAAADLPIVWYEEARRLIGTKEIAGKASNPKILQWAGKLGIPYKGDDIPWCGLFTAHCVGSTLPGEALPKNPLLARNWTKFGAKCKPVLGSILVFWRGSKNASTGHVGFYFGEDDDAFHVLGGNQSDQVNVARVARNRLLDARQPATVPPLKTGPVRRNKSGGLSSNEA